jgi:DNA-3-methyladenine glycosylase II
VFVGKLFPHPPYHFELSIRLARHHSVLDQLQDGEYWRALTVDGALTLVRVVNRGTITRPELDVYRMAASQPVADKRLLARVAHLLGVEAPIQPFYEAAQRDPTLWRLVEPLYGLKHVRAASLFEALATSVIEQQIGLHMAQRGERWLIARSGQRMDYNGTPFYTFPTPQALANDTVEDLLPLKITRIRINVLLNIARQAAAGTLNLDALAALPADEAHSTLMQLKGVGQWTAAWAVIRAQGAYCYIGENDVALQAAINRFYFGQNGRVPQAVVKETLSRYGAFAGAAAFYILMQWALLRYGDS